MDEKIRKIGLKISLVVISILILSINYAFVLGLSGDASTSVFSVQRTDSFSSYSSLMSGVQNRADSSNGLEDIYDVQFMIPPGGCQPYIVRSDLLEEQSVPVFCQVVPLKINPSISISRIQSMHISQQTQSEYVSGVSFHPARAAIRAQGNYVSNPDTDAVGYVVVVLKQQTNEKLMPDSVNITLSASLQFGGTGSFGIGESEFSLPVLSESEFENNYLDYSFFDGLGYVRVESISEDGNYATISVYSADGKSLTGFRKIFTGTIERGKTSSDFYLSSLTGGQGLRITLKDIGLPKIKARVMVNGQTFDAVVGEKFYNGRCSIVSLKDLGEGSGSVTVRCNNKDFKLEKKINAVRLQVGTGEVKGYILYEDLGVSDPVNKYYLVYTNQISNIAQYAFIAKIPVSVVSKLSEVELKNYLKDIGSDINIKVNVAAKDVSKIKAITGKEIKELGNWKLILVSSNVALDAENNEIKFSSITNIDDSINDNAWNYLNNAVNAYDDVEANYGVEKYLEGRGLYNSYGEAALWQEYQLAKSLNQNSRKNQILSRIENQYPLSRLNGNGQTATQIINAGDILSNEGSNQYDSKLDISIQLLAVTEPSSDEAGVKLSYNMADRAVSGSIYHSGDVVYRSDKGDKVITLISFDNNKVDLKCSNKLATGAFKDYPISGGIGKTMTSIECGGNINVEQINLKKVARIQLTPIYRGRTTESNFTFAIGIEKRLFSIDLTPEEANKKIADLNKQIAEYKNITESLGKAIEIGKLTCLGVSTAINLKNLVAGIGGEATARKEVMAKWNKLCEDSSVQKAKDADSVEDCINKYSSDIEKDVDSMKSVMGARNTEIESLKNNPNVQINGKADYGKMFIYEADGFAASPPAFSIMDSVGNELNQNEKLESGDSKTIMKIIQDMNASAGDIYQEEFNLMKENIAMLDSGFSDYSKKEAKRGLYSIILQLRDREFARESQLQYAGSARIKISSPLNILKRDRYAYMGETWKNQYTTSDPSISIATGKPIAVVAPYLFVLPSSKGTVTPIDVYRINGDNIEKVDDNSKQNLLSSYIFESYEGISLTNKCRNCNSMKVFSLEPYKGLPAQLPIDCEEGWYVQTKNNLPGGFGLPGTSNSKSFTDAGNLNSFYLCNVGENGMMEGLEMDAKNCIKFDISTGQPLNTIGGLSETEARRLINKAITSVNDAQRQLAGNPTIINIGNCRNLKVKNSEGDTGSKCTDFMSAGDCQKIFNVCDPFICPNSRCDFGGTYKLDNVIQSGLFGSTFSCLANFIGFNKETGVVVPFCITGINAGLEGWISILESYRDCINESVTNNKTVGICDEIHSVYVCDFFWRQIGPYTNAIIKNMFLWVFGRGDHGGGEYLFVQDAWSNAEKSMQFFQSSYAKDSKLSFGVKELTNTIVTDICKAPQSATYPSGIDEMLTPESPFQFYANFEEIPYTDAVVPPTSQYSVYYHIFAGNENGHYYQVYLKDSPDTQGYVSKDISVIASGYVAKGQSADEKRDFIDVSGFKQLCVKIDAKDSCGFKSVSTSAALNMLKDAAVKDQLSNDVKTEKECISGSASIGSLLTPNVQQATEETINPELYNQGIIRVCSGRNPGETTEPSRWKDVGSCDIATIRCWVDTRSVKQVIKGRGIENETLTNLEKINFEDLINKGGYLREAEADDKIQVLFKKYEAIKTARSLNEENLDKIIRDIDDLMGKITIARQNAQLLFKKAEIYSDYAINAYNTGVVSASSPGAAKAETPAVDNSILLAKMIYGETNGQPEQQKIAAGWVAMNRLNSGEFSSGDDLQGVITSGQFKGYKDTNPSSEVNVVLAQKIIDNQIKDNTGGALYFFHTSKPIEEIKTLFESCGIVVTDYKLISKESTKKDMYVYKEYCDKVVEGKTI